MWVLCMGSAVEGQVACNKAKGSSVPEEKRLSETDIKSTVTCNNMSRFL